MKRLFLILCGALALAACNKTVENSLRNGEDNAEGRIVFRAEQLTKSITESTASVLQADGFKVAAVTGTTTFFNENVSYVNEKSWFETAQTYYYPSVATNFFAVYPKTQAIFIDGTGAATLEYASDNNTDLISAMALNVSAREDALPLVFDHILSQVVIKCQGADANAEYVVKSVTLSNTDAATYAYSSGEWIGADKDKATAIVSSNTAASTSAFTTMGEAVTVVPAEMDLRVTWDCLQGTTVVGSYDETVSFTPTMGKVCTVNCTLPNKDAKAIKFTINVNPWGEETQNVVLTSPVSIAVDNTFVGSLANVGTKSLSSTDLDIDELVDNLADGSKVNVTLNDGEFSISTDIEDLDNPETDGGKIYLTSNSEETEGYSYEILYDEDEWKIKSTGYLIFEAITDGTIVWKAANNNSILTLNYSIDKGDTWTEWTSSTEGTSIDVLAGDIIFIKGSSGTLNTATGRYSFFDSGTANYYVYGNIDALINNASLSQYVFYCLFVNNESIRNHPIRKIILPANSVSVCGYETMFGGCTGLTSAPVLSATTLENSCYVSMFADCTGLITAPELPATSLAIDCYRTMFSGCTSLTSAPVLPATTLAKGCYNGMFNGCTGLTTAPVLPATTLAEGCYNSMFNGCTGLTTAPVLPATSLATNCYLKMFSGCTSLTSAPALPATTLAESCYNGMFKNCINLISAPQLPGSSLRSKAYYEMFKGCVHLSSAPILPASNVNVTYAYGYMFEGCTSLTTAPELPATTLGNSCYAGMFKGCVNLTTAPELPATTLARSCYYEMFSGCTGLISAPTLPAVSLMVSCYYRMFYNCSNLNYVKALFTTAPSTNYTSDWLYNVSSTGTFVKNSAATWNVTGTHGIPSGWTVQTASE